MKRLLTAVVLIPLVLLLVFRSPVELLAVIVAAVAILCAREFLDIVRAYNVAPMRLPTYISIALLFALVAWLGSLKPTMGTGTVVLGFTAAASLAAFVFLAIAMRRAELATAYPAAAAAVFALVYVGMPLALLVQVRQFTPGVVLVLYLLIVVWSGDTFAYYVGRSIGRHNMAPRVSPKKTWEGAVASVVGSVLLGTYVLAHSYQISTWLWNHHLLGERQYGWFTTQPLAPIGELIVLSAVLNIAAQLGDLVESAIKRGANVKDSGAILPGHGGMLDRIDALLFAAPVLWVYAAWRVLNY
jgi:phosphatidate cytidylyltransferase